MTVIIENTGVVPLTSIAVSTGSADFVVTQPAVTTLEASETASFTVKPAIGLKPGAGAAMDAPANEFKGVITVSCDGAANKTFDVGFLVNNTYSSSFVGGPYTIPPQTQGYVETTTADIKLVATGTGQVDGKSPAITITGSTEAFDIVNVPTGAYSLRGLGYPEGTVPASCEFKVTPKTGLAPGTYSITIKFDAYKGAGATTTVTFIVTP